MAAARYHTVVTPNLTVAIAAAGSAQPLLATLRSLGFDPMMPSEILVIDDGLHDPGALRMLVEGDPRVRICRNECPLGPVASLERALPQTTTPLITLLRPGEVVLPGALRTLATAVHESGDIGVAHAYWFPIDSLRRMSRDRLRKYRRALVERLPATVDHRRALVVQGNILQALPTFRRDLLLAAGGFRGPSVDDALYGATLRILNRAEALLVPRLLCGRQITTTRPWGDGGFRRYLRHIALCARAMRGGGAEYLRTRQYRLARLAAIGLFRQLPASFPRHWLDGAHERARRFMQAARSMPLLKALARRPTPYGTFVWLVRRWPFDILRPARGRPRPANGERIAYVLWRYPTLTETFVRREVQALRAAGVHLDVFALEPADPPVPDDPESPAGPVTYFGARQSPRPPTRVLEYFRKKPWMVLRLWFFVVRHEYRDDKRWWHDWGVLYDAVQLAAALAERGATHVHSPWANQSALLGFMASRMLSVTYSVQARASEIHRSGQAPMVAHRVRFAEFLITNSRYNERYLRSILGRSPDLPIHTIYNGIELFRFGSSTATPGGDMPPRVVAVGRLVESKGFCYLLHACRLLRDRGVDFTCEIIGGPEDPTDTITWIDLRKLQTGLDLESTVHFMGAMSFANVLSWYRKADIVVLPSVRARDGSHDVTPNTLIEAMAMRLPVVSTTTGAIPEIVDHEITGLLVPPNDSRGLAEALERLLLDSKLRRALGEAGRRKVEERFDIDRNVKERAELFWCGMGRKTMASSAGRVGQ